MNFTINWKIYGMWYRCFAWFPKHVATIRTYDGFEARVYHWLRFVECTPYSGMKGHTWYWYRPEGDDGEGV